MVVFFTVVIILRRDWAMCSQRPGARNSCTRGVGVGSLSLSCALSKSESPRGMLDGWLRPPSGGEPADLSWQSDIGSAATETAAGAYQGPADRQGAAPALHICPPGGQYSS